MIPYSIFLVPYLFVIIFFIGMAGSAFYHIIRFDFVTRTTITAIVLFVGGILIIFGVSFYHFRTIPWGDGISLRVSSSNFQQVDDAATPFLNF